MIFPGNRRIADAIRSSQLSAFVDVAPVRFPEGLTRNYLAKERTSTAERALRHQLRGKRKPGSHQLPGGGDRVILSRALLDDAIAVGRVEPWKRTNARRTELRKRYRLRKLTARATYPIGQVELFPKLAAPPARLRDFFGSMLSPSAALELEHHRKRLGMTQSQLGAIAGLSQPQIANAVRCGFGLSFDATARLKAVLLAPERVAA